MSHASPASATSATRVRSPASSSRWSAARIGVAVADDEYRGPPARVADRVVAEAVERGRESLGTCCRVPHRAEGGDEEPGRAAQRRHLLAEQDRMLEAQQRLGRQALSQERAA